MYKFENLDIIKSLSKIAKKNTAFYMELHLAFQTLWHEPLHGGSSFSQGLSGIYVNFALQ